MTVKASESLYSHIKHSEGYRENPYKDITGKTTVGYGTSDGKINSPMSEAEADQAMRQRVKLAETELSSKIVRKNLNQGQMDALLDMHYNLGMEKMSANGFIDLVNQGRDDEVSTQIQKYTNARNAKTGELEQLPGLVKRVAQRSEWWNGVQRLNPSVASNAINEDVQGSMDMLDEYFSDKKQEAGPQVGALIDTSESNITDEAEDIAETLRFVDQQESIGVISKDNIGYQIQQTRMAQGISTIDEANREQTVKDLSKELGIDPLVVDAKLEVSTPEEIRTSAKIPDLVKANPILSKWMTVPNNYVLAENTGDWTNNLSRISRQLSPEVKSDLSKTIRSGFLEYPKSAVYTSWLYGAITSEQAAKNIQDIENRQAELRVSDELQSQQKEIQKANQNLIPSVTKMSEGIRDTTFGLVLKTALESASKEQLKKVGPLSNLNSESLYSFLAPSLNKAYDGTVESFDSFLDYMSTIFKNPEGFGLNVAQGITSSVGAIGLPILGTAVGQPIAGIASGISVGTMLSAGESISDDLQQFRDPNTGAINFAAAMSNPAAISRMRSRAATYGVTMGVSDAVYSRFVGKFFTKSVAKAASKKGIKAVAKGVAKGVAKEVGVGALEEGASEFTASVAREVVVGELTSKKLGEIGAKTAEEAVTGGVSGGIIGGSLGSVRTVKNKFFKMQDTLKKSSKANSDMVDISETKTVLNSEDAAKTNKDQIKDLLDANIEPPALPDKTSIYADVEKLAASEAKIKEKQNTEGGVQIAPSELKQFFEEQGLNPEDTIALLPESVVSQFLENREDDVSINIPISEWLQVMEDHPGVEEIIRVSGNDFNAREANENIEEIQSNPFSLFEEEGELPPLVPNQEVQPPPVPSEDIADQEVGTEEFKPSEAIALSDITTPFANPEEQKAYNTLSTRLRKSLKKVSGVSSEAGQAFVDIQYQHLKNRADTTGRDILDLAKGQTFKFGVKQGAAGAFTPVVNKILFTPSSNVKTVVHEFGHSWLDEMGADYTFMSGLNFEDMTVPQKDYWYSMNKTAELLGLSNMGELNQMSTSDPKFKTLHETFAQTSEEYFLAGRFGDSKIKAAMEVFRDYMLKLLRVIRDYDSSRPQQALDLTPEVERLFEGILGVASKQDETLSPMFPEPMLPIGVLGNRSEEYYNTTRDAQVESLGHFASKIMNSDYRERESLIKAAEDSAYDEAAELVASQPEMILAAQMEDQFKEFNVRRKAGEKVSDPRISEASFAKLFEGDENALNIARLSIPVYAIAGKKKGGVDVSSFMHSLDINESEDLVNLLMSMGTQGDQIATLANKILDEKHPILKSDEDIRDEAVSSLSNSKVNRFLNLEVKILAEKYLPTLKGLTELFITSPETMATKGYINNKAINSISRASVATFSVKLYQTDWGRHARAAAKYFRKGDFANAFDSKIKSAISYNSWKMAQRVSLNLAAIDKKANQFIKFTKSKDYKNTHNAEMMLFGKAFIEHVRTHKGDMPILSLDVFPPGSGVDQSMIDNVNHALVDFSTMSQGAYGARMNVETFINFGAVIDTIKKQARAARKIEREGVSIPLEQVIQETEADIRDSKSLEVSYEEGYGVFKRNKDTARTAINSLYISNDAFIQSALGETFGELGEGEGQRNIDTRADIKVIQDAMIKIAKVSKDSGFRAIVAPIVNRFAPSKWNMDKNSKPIISTKDELGITFNNMAEYIMAALIMGSPSGAEKFLRGGTKKYPGAMAEYDINTGKLDTSGWDRLTERLISEGTLKKEHFEAMSSIWDMLREKQPAVRDSLRENDGYIMGNIEGHTVTNSLGSWEGGYVPVAEDKKLSSDAKFEELVRGITDPDTNMISPFTGYLRQNTGMANERNKTFPANDLNINRLVTYAGAANDIIHMRKSLKKMLKILSDPRIIAALEDKRPGALEHVIRPWFLRVVNQQRVDKPAEDFNRLAAHIRRGINRTIYMFNTTTALKQYFGLVPGLVAVKPKYLLKGMLQVAGNTKKSIDDISAKDPVMKDRFDATLRRIINEYDQLNKHDDWVTKFFEVQDKITFIMIQMAQNQVDVAIYYGALAESGAKGFTEVQARHAANNAVQSTQSSSAVSWLNNLQTQSALSKLAQGIATSYLFTINNLMTKEAMRNPNRVAQAKTIMAFGVMVLFTNSLLDQALEGAIKAAKGDDEEEEKKRRRQGKKPESTEDKIATFVGRSAVNMLGPMFPIISSPVTSYMYSGSPDIAPAATLVTKAHRSGFSGLLRGSQGINMTPSEMRGILKTISIWSGVNVSVLGKDLFIEEIWIKGLNEETLDARLRKRRQQLKIQRRAR